MKIKIWHIFFRFVALFTACNNSSRKMQNRKPNTEDIYTCSMHPQVLEHHPGNCPICGMKLIKKNASQLPTNNIELETLLKPTNEFVVASLTVTTPELKKIDIPVKVYGTIEYDTRAASTISARVSGRIEKLYIRFRYQAVEKGQKIMDIYSPEFLTAEQNLLFLLKTMRVILLLLMQLNKNYYCLV